MSQANALPSLVFPAMDDERDFIISNFVQDASAVAGESGTGQQDEFELPFGQIPRGDRIGRIADWTGLSAEAGQQRGARRSTAITNTASKVEEEQEGWSLSLGHTASMPGVTRRSTAARPVRGAPSANIIAAPGRGAPQTRGGPRRYGAWGNRPSDRIREPSIKVGQDWKLIEELEFSRLSKVQINVDEPTVVASFGSAKVYDRNFDKLKAKAEKALTDEGVLKGIVSASDDLFIQECFAKDEATIYTTDAVASLLMACQRTVQPWDIVVRRRGAAVFFDARPDSKVNLVFVNETAADSSLPDEGSETINSMLCLAAETTRLNNSIGEFFGKGQPSVKLGAEANTAIAPAYRYSKFKLGESFSMLVRSEVSNAMTSESNGELALSRALLDTEANTMDWKQRLDTQRGAVLAQAMKNNGATLARWIYSAVFGGCSSLKLAYVARQAPKSPQRHLILGVHDFEPYDLAKQMSLNVANGFGILRALADLCLSLPENQTYAIVRDANKPLLRLYSVPQ